jgi:N-hydroxyarylamine O-acetyltransferase
MSQAGEAGWVRQHRFTTEARGLGDFAEMCTYHQTSPASHFTRKRICSLATREGRVSLSDDRLIVTRRGERTERRVADEAERAAVLRDLFGVDAGAS